MRDRVTLHKPGLTLLIVTDFPDRNRCTQQCASTRGRDACKFQLLPIHAQVTVDCRGKHFSQPGTYCLTVTVFPFHRFCMCFRPVYPFGQLCCIYFPHGYIITRHNHTRACFDAAEYLGDRLRRLSSLVTFPAPNAGLVR